LLGAILATLAMFGMPNASVLLAAGRHAAGAGCGHQYLDGAVPRLVGDLLPKEQPTTGYAVQTFFIGVGAVAASALSHVLQHWFNVANTAAPGHTPDSVVYSSTSAARYSGRGAVDRAAHARVSAGANCSNIILKYSMRRPRRPACAASCTTTHMPRIMVQLSLVQFFTWFTWFSMWTYGTATVTQHIYHATDTHSALYNDGANRRVRRGLQRRLDRVCFPAAADRAPYQPQDRTCFGAAGGRPELPVDLLVSTPGGLLLPFVGIGLAGQHSCRCRMRSWRAAYRRIKWACTWACSICRS
jgi:maltose/moltooligosaccharide transporter